MVHGVYEIASSSASSSSRWIKNMFYLIKNKKKSDYFYLNEVLYLI